MKITTVLCIFFLILGCQDDAEPLVIETPTSPTAEIKKIAAWGDSFTQGGGITMPEFAFPVQLQKLSGYEVYNGGIGGQTSTQIKQRMLAATDKKEHMAIIWAGSNNTWQPDVIKEDVAEMVKFLGHDRYLVLSILNDKNEKKGTQAYQTIMSLNQYFKDTYKQNYMDVRTYLVSLSNGSAADEQDRANDVVPGSMRSDDAHLTDRSYTLLAKYIYDNWALIKK